MRFITLFFLAFTFCLLAAPSNQTGNGILSYGNEGHWFNFVQPPVGQIYFPRGIGRI
jgi:hypothetical protein